MEKLISTFSYSEAFVLLQARGSHEAGGFLLTLPALRSHHHPCLRILSSSSTPQITPKIKARGSTQSFDQPYLWSPRFAHRGPCFASVHRTSHQPFDDELRSTCEACRGTKAPHAPNFSHYSCMKASEAGPALLAWASNVGVVSVRFGRHATRR